MLKQLSKMQAVLLSLSFFLFMGTETWASRDGEAVYKAECTTCHTSGAERMPTLQTLKAMPTESIVQSLESGTMRIIGTFNLNGPERVAVAEYITGKTYDPNWNAQQQNTCTDQSWPSAKAEKTFAEPHWNGWGNGVENRRFQNAESAKLSLSDVKKLELQWAFAFPGETIAESQPTVVGGRIFVGSRSGVVYSLDAKTACIHWTYQADGPVKNSVLIGEATVGSAQQLVAYFGDLGGNAYAVNAQDGRLLWRKRVDDHPAARIMGSFQLIGNQLIVPVTSLESTLVAKVAATCCTFRGSVVSYDASSGEQRWKRYTIDQKPAKVGENANGADIYGPAGATVWTAPTFDAKKRLLYIGTGENSVNPPTTTSDAVLAVNVDTSDVVWTYQGLSGDAWNMSCGTEDKVNCPQDAGPDYDMGSSPSLSTLANGKRVLIATQKSGVVHALDPDDNGKLLWQRQVAQGGILGGIEWGPATDGKNIYVAIADISWDSEDLLDPALALNPNAGGGLVALDLADGHVVWEAPAITCGDRPQCSPAQTAAVTAIPGVVFAGSISGHLRAFDTRDGRVLWTYDTARTYQTVNKAKGKGGALDATGPVVVDGWMYVVSGYSKWGGLPGNVLLAFAPAKE